MPLSLLRCGLTKRSGKSSLKVPRSPRVEQKRETCKIGAFCLKATPRSDNSWLLLCKRRERISSWFAARGWSVINPCSVGISGAQLRRTPYEVYFNFEKKLATCATQRPASFPMHTPRKTCVDARENEKSLLSRDSSDDNEKCAHGGRDKKKLPPIHA